MAREVTIDQIHHGPLKNNVYIVGDQHEAIVIDAAHDAEVIKEHIGERQLKAILCTHGHFDHIDAAPVLADATSAPIYMHPDDKQLWRYQHPECLPDESLTDGMKFSVGDIELRAVHTPGHTQGSMCFYTPELQTLFTGDTLFPGGPGATRWKYSDFDQIIRSIRGKLFKLPDETQVLAGHGRPTSIATEKPALEEWMQRGW